jgi:two-component system, OmpR family, sensor histidine kinase KdpD
MPDSSPRSDQLSLNFFFIPKYYTFSVADPKNIGGLVIFLIVSIVGGSLLSAAWQVATEARHQRAETEVALTLSRAMSGYAEPSDALKALCREVVRAFDAPGAAVLTGSGAPGPCWPTQELSPHLARRKPRNAQPP